MRKKNIAIVYGGYSSEEAVSLRSAEGVMSCIDKALYEIYPVHINRDKWVVALNGNEYPVNKSDFSANVEGSLVTFDCAYVTIHGTPGEDGLLQGYLQMIGVPHTTCDVLPAALTFNKFACNNYLRAAGVKVANSILVNKGEEFNPASIAGRCGLPCFVKPNAGGSSFGVTKVKTIEQIEPAINKAFIESDGVLVEQLLEGTEVTCGLYKTASKTVILPITEIISANEFFDHEAKYTPGKANEITPARIPGHLTDEIQNISLKIYELLGCRGFVRIDYIIKAEGVYLLEVNTTPGMTPTSFIPQQIKAKGLDPVKVFTEIIEDSIAWCKR